MKTRLTLAFLPLLFLAFKLSAQIERVKNINAVQDFGSGAQKFAPADSVFYFSANDGLNGPGLWRSNGTAAGTKMVKQVSIPDLGTFYQPLTSAGGILYFIGTDKEHGQELWKSDGTETGTRLLVDLTSGIPGSDIRQFTPVDSTSYFSIFAGGNTWSLWQVAGDQANQICTAANTTWGPGIEILGAFGHSILFHKAGEFWITDGSTAGTQQLHADPADIRAGDFSVLQGVCYFSRSAAGSKDYELWRSDGTPAGTYRVKDIWPGPGSGWPRQFTALANRVYFIASDSLHGFELWGTDGTEAGTALVSDIIPGLEPAAIPSDLTLFTFKSQLHYIFTSPTNHQWWKSDGSDPGTHFAFNFSGGDRWVVSNDRVFYRGPGQQAYSSDLWRSDGTAAGTIPMNVAPGTPNPDLQDFAVFKNRLVFSAVSTRHGREPWITDGTQDGTVELLDVNTYSAGSNPYFLAPTPDHLYFIANDGIHGPELWQSDGSETGTVLTADITPGMGAYNNLLPLGAVGNSMYFKDNAGLGTGDLRIWRTDGTKPAVLLLDTFPGSFLTDKGWFMAVQDKAILRIKDGSGSRLFAASAVPGNAVLLTDTPVGEPLVPRSGFGFFWSAGNKQLWRTDGTPAGTTRLFTFPINYNPISVDQVAPLGSNGIVFASGDSLFGRELWTSDGTTSGTKMIADLTPGQAGSKLSQFTPVGEGMVCFLSAESQKIALWRTDGTEAGTIKLAGFDAIPFSKTLFNLTATGSELFFLVQIVKGVFEVWKSDRSVDGTVKVADTQFPYFEGDEYDPPGPVIHETEGIGHTFFFAPLGPDGVELWQSDGTAAGTVQVADLRPGPAGSNPCFMTELNGRLYFVAAEGAPQGGDPSLNGSELYRTTATYVGTISPVSTHHTDLSISPNPCSGYFQIEAVQPGAYRMQLTDAAGKTVLNRELQVSTSRIRVDGIDQLPAGVYFARLIDTQTGSLKTGKILKR